MATAKKAAGSASALPKKETDRYFNAMTENQKILNEALEAARQRGVRISEDYAKRVSAGQLAALEQVRAVSEDPSSYFKVMLEATSSAQNEALEFLRAVYSEQQESAEELRSTMSALVESSQEAASAAAELARAWTPSNPFAEAMQKAYDSATAAPAK